MTQVSSKAASPMDAASVDTPQEARLADALTVGAQVMFAEDEDNTTSLGVISRVWPNGKYVSVMCDGHLYVRLIGSVRPCR